MPSGPPDVGAARPPAPWRLNALLFLATVASVMYTAMSNSEDNLLSRAALAHGGQFTLSLLAVLVAHEAGHYVAARIHRVGASLPYFIPMPLLSPFGTMGAVIRMEGTIPTRRALLDIGASGPLAGLVFAIPLYTWGFAHSKLVPLGEDGIGLGASLLTKVLEASTGRVVPAGMDVELSPVAFGAWGGLFVTMINLLPVGQLDGGHVAYALLGRRQDSIAPIVHRSMIAFFFVSVVSFVVRDVRGGLGLVHLGTAVNSSLFWLIWFEVAAILGSLSSRAQESATARRPTDGVPIRTRAMSTVALALLAGVGRDHGTPLLWAAWFIGLGFLLAMEIRSGTLRSHSLLDHPPTGAVPLDPARKVIAVVTLAFFVLLFMPTPFVF